MFVVDDGTGLVEVLVWERRFERESKIDWNQIQLGALVRVRGRLSCYQGAAQLTLSSIDYLAEDGEGIVEEIEQWRLVEELANSAYCKSDHHLKGLESMLEEQQMLHSILGQNKKPTSVQETMGVIFMHLSENATCTEVELRELFDSVDRQTLRSALIMLCDNGGAYWVEGEAAVTQIRPEGNLSVLIESHVKSRREGLPIMEIETAVHADSRFSCVRRDQVEYALEYLAKESKIYNTGEGTWKIV